MKKSIFRKVETRTQPLKFCVVGVLNTLIHYFVFFVLYHSVGVYYLFASGIGYFFGLVHSFILNRIWTFRIRGRDQVVVQFLRFVVVNSGAFLANLIVLGFTVSNALLSAYSGQAVAILFATSINFLGNKLWTFRNR